MHEGFPLLEAHQEAEAAVRSASIQALGDTYHYFQYLQETLLIAFKNSGSPLEVADPKNDPAVFALVATTKAFSVARTAMQQSLLGYPIVGLALSRLLSEIVQSSQYLVRHPGLIDAYLSGSLKLDRVQKMASEEPSQESGAFGRFWGLQSHFSHASQDFLVLGWQTNENTMKSTLVWFDPKILSDIAYGIIAPLFLQYFTFRTALRGRLVVEEVLQERDHYIFLPANVRRFLGFTSLSDGALQEAHDFLTAPSHNKDLPTSASTP